MGGSSRPKLAGIFSSGLTGVGVLVAQADPAAERLGGPRQDLLGPGDRGDEDEDEDEGMGPADRRSSHDVAPDRRRGGPAEGPRRPCPARPSPVEGVGPAEAPGWRRDSHGIHFICGCQGFAAGLRAPGGGRRLPGGRRMLRPDSGRRLLLSFAELPTNEDLRGRVELSIRPAEVVVRLGSVGREIGSALKIEVIVMTQAQNGQGARARSRRAARGHAATAATSTVLTRRWSSRRSERSSSNAGNAARSARRAGC